MKKYILPLILLICVGVLWKCTSRQPQNPPASLPDLATEESVGRNASPVEQEQGSQSEFLDNIQKAITLQNSYNSKFEFYGLVVDQHGDPIEGAFVRMQTTKYKRSIGLKIDYSHEDFIRNSEAVYTDASGRFEFREGFGSSLLIEEISKEGYVAARGKMNISFLSTSGALHKPDSSSPVVYTMWKKSGAEPLVKEDFRMRFYKGDPPQGISLVQGRWIKTNTADADLIISASMEEPDSKRPFQYDWQVTIAPVNGGLIETDDIFPYEAPESGYQKNYSFSQKKGDVNWVSSIPNLSFYIKSRDGQIYGNLMIDFSTHRSGRFFTVVKILANPNGSRNLEYDPDLRIKP